MALEEITAAPVEKEGILKQTIREITQPFKDIFNASRAMWGINLSYLLEGLIYFGFLILLTTFFNENIGLNDIDAGHMVVILTAGITFSMLIFGATSDIIGIRKSLLISLIFMLIGRIILTISPGMFGTKGLYSSSNIMAVIGIMGIVIGYGMYQPACYAAVKQFTTEKTAAIGYAMLYALMNLGAFLPSFISPPLRKAFGITTVFWVYNVFTVVGILVIAIILTKKAMKDCTLTDISKEKKTEAEEEMTFKEKMAFYIKNFPLRDKRFLFFIFILIPVQTLFAHNWLTLPSYFSRAFTGFVKNNFELFTNLNSVLIFVLTPMVAALTAKRNAYKMMILGTFVMASPTFLLATGPNVTTIFAYIIIMSIGEAMWQPRFLQWVAEIAPKGQTGIYMGIGQFPWFLTKIVTGLYSGWFLMHYCPAGVDPSKMNTNMMWLIYGFIAIISPIGLILAKGWMMKGFKTKAVD
jgi:proton-dependent oligopeptide transporter, POT family